MESSIRQETTNPEMGEAELEAQVAARQQRRAQREAAEGPAHDPEVDGPRSGHELKKGLAQFTSEDARELDRAAITEVETVNALDAFLSAEEDSPDALSVEPLAMKLNVGTAKSPKYVKWVIEPIEDTEITAIRKMSESGSRQQRRRGETEIDESLVAKRIVLRSTLEPRIDKLVEATKAGSPEDALQAYFKRFGKTGLITQISGKVLEISGWDDDDISDLDAARG